MFSFFFTVELVKFLLYKKNSRKKLYVSDFSFTFII